ncbi:hypothetical protein F2P81_004550 [Scophthalmus maximus]|uniref:Uncharacterized protein n=1 Tax=Scophthalmus maximus TaxID=52904 RepID=A0A6A4TB47_SCOMX|nr:hypothetical protein F2P81_004550 [Scophthalmus maximus]
MRLLSGVVRPLRSQTFGTSQQQNSDTREQKQSRRRQRRQGQKRQKRQRQRQKRQRQKRQQRQRRQQQHGPFIKILSVFTMCCHIQLQNSNTFLHLY